jgi:putative glutamine amidotransferase
MKRPLIGLNTALIDMDDELKGKACCSVAYFDAVTQAGGIPMIIPPYADSDSLEQALDRLDGFCLIGGPDYHPSIYGGHPQPNSDLLHPRRNAFDLQLAEVLLKKLKKPVLGICGGHQLMSITYRGALVQDLFTEWPSAQECGQILHAQKDREGEQKGNVFRHPIRVEPSSKLAKILGANTVEVNSFHHQAIQPQQVGEGLIPTAWAYDGVIEAFESKSTDRFLIGVQWHPERLTDQEPQRALFKAFVDAAKG